MVKVSRRPSNRRVAIITLITAGNMRWVFSCSHRAIVAAETRTQDFGMVNLYRWLPKSNRVAILTNICCGDMRWVLTGSFDPIMTTGTIIRDALVVEYSRSPRQIIVTSIAFSVGDDMARRQPFGDNAVVTTSTPTDSFTVVKPKHYGPTSRDMARRTIIGGIRMLGSFESFRVRTRTIVAGGTLPRRSCKHTIDVAGPTIHILVLTFELKAMNYMVVNSISRLRTRAEQRQH